MDHINIQRISRAKDAAHGCKILDQEKSFKLQAASTKQQAPSVKLDKLQAVGYYRIMKRKINNNDLTHYFIRDHRELPASYLKSCEKFFKQIRKANHERNKKEK